MHKNRKFTNLKIKILERGHTQRYIAKKSAIHETTLSQITNGRINPTDLEKQKIAQALNLSVHEVFGE